MTALPPNDDGSERPADEPSTRRTAPRLGFAVVGIGASAGGLEPLETLTRRLTADRTAFIIMQHQAPDHVSMLGEILARGATLPVVTAERGTRIKPGTIYVAPPAIELVMDGDGVSVTSGESPARHHSIDAFLRSLARVGGPMAVGVILSGSGSDGTLGLQAIKSEGGITFVQDPATAAQASMPQSALDTGCADFSMTPEEIGDELVRLSAHPYLGRAPSADWLDRDVTAKILTLLRHAHGVDFALYKQNTVERRISRRVALHRLETADDYLRLLAADPAEVRSLYNDLLIGVTSFFRDAEPFEALKTVVFPRLLEGRSPDAPIRVWVAGCSTGEESYSIAIALLEFLAERGSSCKVQIFATDIDEDALVRARHGVYPTNIELDVGPERLQRFFTRTDKGLQVSRQVRDLVVFARHNLGKDPPFSHMDLIACRNVLIYMQAALQRRVLRIFHYALSADGFLLLGPSESIGDAGDLFSQQDRKLRVYARKSVPAVAAFDVSLGTRPAHADEAHEVPVGRRTGPSLAQSADRKVIEKYAPPGAIVDEKLDVVQFRGKIAPYLEPAPGAATLNLLKLARPELLVPLKATVQRALIEGRAATSPPVPMWGEGSRAVSIDVTPLPDTTGHVCLLVLFAEGASPRQPVQAAATSEHVDLRLDELQRELTTNKEYLQSTVEELEAANEELQSSNEELQSSNEELQSTNEELETSKDELQSANEELATVNEELHSRMGQLAIANDDLENILANASAAVVLLGPDMRIRRFSAVAEKLLNLLPGDVGRPVGYLRNVISTRDIEQVARETMGTIASREQRVRCIDGSWYQMRMMPYRTADDTFRGLVMEFVKTAPPSAGTDGAEIPPLTQRLLSTLRQPLILIDGQLRLIWANRAFFEAFAVGPAAMGRPLSEAWGSPTDPPELWAFLEEATTGQSARDVLIEHPFGRMATRPMRFSGRRVASETDDRVAITLVLIEEA